MSIEHSIEILKETIKNLKEHKSFNYSNEEKIVAYEMILHLINSQKNGLLRDNIIIDKQQKEIEELKHFKEEVSNIIKYADDTAEPTYWNIRKLLGLGE